MHEEMRGLECEIFDALEVPYRVIDTATGDLGGPASALMRSFRRISRDIDAAGRQESAYNQRLALNAVEDRLVNARLFGDLGRHDADTNPASNR